MLDQEPSSDAVPPKTAATRCSRSRNNSTGKKSNKNRYEPSKGLYANLIASMDNLSLGKNPNMGPMKIRSKEKFFASVPPAILVFKKVDGNRGKRVIFKRHVPMLMVRGDNIVTISCEP